VRDQPPAGLQYRLVEPNTPTSQKHLVFIQAPLYNQVTMSRTLEKTLTMLLPTASGGIPKELMDYASSVLNQSRNRISNLNSSEEPAREMICAHLACDR